LPPTAAGGSAPAEDRRPETGDSPPAEDRRLETGDSRPRIYSIRDKTWIWPTPKKGDRYLGYVRTGASIALRATEPVVGEGCRRGFYPVEPRGYVCHDDTVTLDPEHPFLRNNAATLASSGPYPYRYASSLHAPMYARLPTAAEQRKTEIVYPAPDALPPLPRFMRGYQQLAAAEPIAPIDSIPPFLAGGEGARGPVPAAFARVLPIGAMMAFTRAFEHEGRTYLLSADLTVVPADRVREFRRSTFHGTPIGEIALPIAFFRARPRAQWEERDGRLVDSGRTWAARTFVRLTGHKRSQDGVEFLEAAGSLWTAAADATVVEHYGKRPFLVKPGDKWILVSISRGTLVAYDDLTPVYATLASPGRGGIPRPGGNNLEDATTPTGAWRITFKDRATTMAPEIEPGEARNFWVADVPFTQYFDPPFALHGAYWHESFGEPMSAGCINVSPLDAAWLFAWSGPAVPDDWQGATGGNTPENGPATWVVVTR
jgi:L,D-transpeptidase-like protein